MDEKIKTRIRNLLDLAENNPNVHEASIAATRAAKLMAQYNVDRSAVLVDTLTIDQIRSFPFDDPIGRKTIPDVFHAVIIHTAKLYDCEADMIKINNRVRLLGEREDVEIARLTLIYLFNVIDRLCRNHRRAQRKKYGVGHGTNMGDYRLGLIMTIVKSLKAAKIKPASRGTGCDLMVLKGDLIRRKFAVGYIDTPVSVDDYEAFTTGKIHGETVTVNPSID